jgi:hypothetical protein
MLMDNFQKYNINIINKQHAMIFSFKWVSLPLSYGWPACIVPCWGEDRSKATERNSNLPLAFASTVVLVFGPHRDPWAYFCSYQDHLLFWNGASSSTRGEVLLPPSTHCVKSTLVHIFVTTKVFRLFG